MSARAKQNWLRRAALAGAVLAIATVTLGATPQPAAAQYYGAAYPGYAYPYPYYPYFRIITLITRTVTRIGVGVGHTESPWALAGAVGGVVVVVITDAVTMDAVTTADMAMPGMVGTMAVGVADTAEAGAAATA